MESKISLQESQSGTRPFQNVLAMSGCPLNHWWLGDFIIDLETLSYHKERFTLDLEHDPNQFIGYAENFRVTPEGLVCDGAIVEGEKTDWLIKNIDLGTPFEMSLTIETEAGDIETLSKGETAMVNGREVTGPIDIYRNVPLRALAVCECGHDMFTYFTLLKKNFDMKNTKTPPLKKGTKTKATLKSNAVTELAGKVQTLANDLTKLSDPEEETPEETPQVKDKDLAEFIEVFGTEKGLALWQSGADIEEVRQLKALLEKYGTPEGWEAAATDETNLSEGTDDEEDDKTNLSATVKTLADTVTKLAAEVTRLKAAYPRGEEPVSGNREPEAAQKQGITPLSSVDKLAAKYKKTPEAKA